MEDVCADEVAERGADEYVGRPVVAAEQPSTAYGCRCAVGEHFDPRTRIFMRNHAGHGHGEHRMPRGKRRIDVVVTPEITIAIALARALPSRSELHRSVNEECVHQGFYLERPQFFEVIVVSLKPIAPGERERRGSAAQSGV
jgi:hypothetical protein